MKLILNQAFSLVELTIYLSILFILIITLFSFFNKTFMDVIIKSQSNDLLIRASLALDLLKRDVKSASPFLRDWNRVCEKRINNFVFKKENLTTTGKKISKSICWQLNKMRLNRIEGAYDFKSKQWGKRVISLVCSGIKTFELNLILSKNKKYVIRVNVRYLIDDKAFEEKIFLQNMVI